MMASSRTRSDLLRRDLRIGIGHREDDRVRRHRADHVGREGALDGEAEDHVGAFASPRRACAPSVSTAWADFHWFMPSVRPLIDDALGVAEDDVARREAHRLEQLGAGDARRRRRRSRRACVFAMSRPVRCSALMSPAAAMIAVPCWSSWKTGNVHQLAQALLDDEAFGRLDVLEIDAAEGGAEIAHRS